MSELLTHELLVANLQQARQRLRNMQRMYLRDLVIEAELEEEIDELEVLLSQSNVHN